MTDAVSAAKLAVYLLLVQPAMYCLWKHGKTGFLGWFYIQLFCILRITTGAMGLNGSQTGVGAVVLNSIGLSPLTVGIAGVFHEVRRATQPHMNRKTNLFWDVQFHLFVAAGMTLIVVAVINLINGNSVSTMKTLLHVGSAISAASWAILLGWVLWSVATTKRESSHAEISTMKAGRTLRNGILVALPVLAIRVGYAIAYLQLITSNPTSSFLRSTAITVCLSVVPEMVCVASLLYVGIVTRSLRSDLKKRDSGFLAPSSHVEMK